MFLRFFSVFTLQCSCFGVPEEVFSTNKFDGKRLWDCIRMRITVCFSIEFMQNKSM